MDKSVMLGLAITAILSLIWLWIGIWSTIRYKPRYERFENSDEKSRNWLIAHIEEAKKEVEVVAGNFNPRVYNEVATAIRDKLQKDQNIEIRILGGPEVFTLYGENDIYNLAKNKTFGTRLLIDFLKKRPHQHFRVIDNRHVYVEDPHGPGVKGRKAAFQENGFFKAWQYKREFERKWVECERISLSEVELKPIEAVEALSEN